MDTENKQSSGQFRLRLPRDLHRDLAQEARDQGVSLNSYVLYLLSTRFSQETAWREASAYYEQHVRETVQNTVRESVLEAHETVSSMILGDTDGEGFVWQNTEAQSVWAQ